MTRLIIGPEKETFDIHEELLCASSPYFRDRLQKIRKPIEGECSICHEDMHEDDEEIVFCRTCGSNFHHDCIKQWEQQNQSDDDTAIATCPLCRVVQCGLHRRPDRACVPTSITRLSLCMSSGSIHQGCP
jgi:hypothetical protein